MPVFHLGITVCERGHIISMDGARDPVTPYCAECGIDTLNACPRCQSKITGPEQQPSAHTDLIARKRWRPPNFCEQCGASFPWVDRDGRIHELENRIRKENLSEADLLIVREQLEALRDPDLPDDEAQRRWERIFKIAPGLRESAGDLIRSIVTAMVLKRLGL